MCFNRNIVECKAAFTAMGMAVTSVLIETLWNVKTKRGEPPPSPSCFNRNIVECKAPYLSCFLHPDTRFNRNIVECKDVSPV